MNTSGIVQALKKEQHRVAKELRGITAALAAFGTTYSQGRRSKNISGSGRARIAAAQRARWAKARERAEAKLENNVAPIRSKQKMSASTRKRIAAAQRARWARLRTRKKAA